MIIIPSLIRFLLQSPALHLDCFCVSLGLNEMKPGTASNNEPRIPLRSSRATFITLMEISVVEGRSGLGAGRYV
jgi:hypothetical protein